MRDKRTPKDVCGEASNDNDASRCWAVEHNESSKCI